MGARDRLAGVHVLLVDDEIDQIAPLQELMADRGISAALATSGEQALAAVALIRPDVAIVDLAMPAMDGLELVVRLRQQLPRLPVVLATARPHHTPLVHAVLGMGNCSYMAKPIHLPTLLATLARLALADDVSRARPPSR